MKQLQVLINHMPKYKLKDSSVAEPVWQSRLFPPNKDAAKKLTINTNRSFV